MIEDLSPWQVMNQNNQPQQKNHYIYLKQRCNAQKISQQISKISSKSIKLQACPRVGFYQHPHSNGNGNYNVKKKQTRLSQFSQMKTVSITKYEQKPGIKSTPISLLPELQLYKTRISCRPSVLENINMNLIRRYGSKNKDKQFYNRISKNSTENSLLARKKQQGIKIYNLFK